MSASVRLLKLRLLLPEGSRSIALVAPSTFLGAAADNDICVAIPGMPETALEFRIDAQGVSAHGLGALAWSQNGEIRQKAELQVGDKLDLAGLRIEVESDAETAPGKSRDAALLAALQSLQERIGTEKSLKPILEAVLHTLQDLLGGSEGVVFSLDAAGNPHQVATSAKWDGKRTHKELYSDSVVQEVIRTRQPLLLRDAMEDKRFSQAESVMSMRLRSALACPVEIAGRLIGIFYLGSTRPSRQFDDSDRETLSLFATLAGSLLHHAAYIAQQNTLLLAARAANPAAGLIAQSPAMRRMLDELDLVAASQLNILLYGETGTGKDRLAQYVHATSPRHAKPFLVVNCSTLRGDMLAGELFGYRRGAFTGAVRDYPGLFLSAQGGTLLLDEVGELELGLQANLLRVLEARKVKPLGQAQELDIDVRILCATHRNLEAMVRQGTFREDLYFRLNQHEVRVPPLRERGEDILLLAYHFLEKAKAQNPQKSIEDFHPSVLDWLPHFRWSGNVRELQNAVMKGAVLSRTPLVELPMPQAESGFLDLEAATLQFQNEHIRKALSLCGEDKEKTAALLKMGRSTLFRRLSEMSGGAAS